MGGSVWLDMPEMGAAGLAEVRGIGNCRAIEPGPGRVITGRFQHSAGVVYDLKLAPRRDRHAFVLVSGPQRLGVGE